MNERSELGLIRRSFRDRIDRAKRITARATAWPLAVRLSVFAAAMLAQVFAYPTSLLLDPPVVLFLLLAVLPAAWPRTAAVSVFWLVTVTGWILSTTVYGGTATLTRLLGLAVTLYVVHTGAALATVLPYDAVVEPVVVARWMLRAAAIIAVGVGGTVAGMYAIVDLSARTYLAATLIGFVPVVALAWLLATQFRRR
jgi:hypothetical protein